LGRGYRDEGSEYFFELELHGVGQLSVDAADELAAQDESFRQRGAFDEDEERVW